MSVMIKELSSRWFTLAYDHIQPDQDIVKNGFKKAGITNQRLGERPCRFKARSPRPE